jgi:hypothetical protein
MYALLIAVVVSASGDPYARCDISDSCGVHDVVLTTGQRTTLVNHVTSQPVWSSIAPSSITRFQCDFMMTPARCRPWYNIVVSTGSDIRDVLLALGVWEPGVDSNSYLVPAAWKYYAGPSLTAATNHIYNVAPQTAGLPLLSYDVRRPNGGGILHADVGYKPVADAAWCAAHADETIVMDGVVP